MPHLSSDCGGGSAGTTAATTTTSERSPSELIRLWRSRLSITSDTKATDSQSRRHHHHHHHHRHHHHHYHPLPPQPQPPALEGVLLQQSKMSEAQDVSSVVESTRESSHHGEITREKSEIDEEREESEQRDGPDTPKSESASTPRCDEPEKKFFAGGANKSAAAAPTAPTAAPRQPQPQQQQQRVGECNLLPVLVERLRSALELSSSSTISPSSEEQLPLEDSGVDSEEDLRLWRSGGAALAVKQPKLDLKFLEDILLADIQTALARLQETLQRVDAEALARYNASLDPPNKLYLLRLISSLLAKLSKVPEEQPKQPLSDKCLKDAINNQHQQQSLQQQSVASRQPQPQPQPQPRNKFTAKKFKIKRANTIDIPNYLREEAQQQQPVPGLRRPLDVPPQPSADPRHRPLAVPSFEPKTDNDRKFLALISRNAAETAEHRGPRSFVPPHCGRLQPEANWTNRFWNIKTNFDKSQSREEGPPTRPVAQRVNGFTHAPGSPFQRIAGDKPSAAFPSGGGGVLRAKLKVFDPPRATAPQPKPVPPPPPPPRSQLRDSGRPDDSANYYSFCKQFAPFAGEAGRSSVSSAKSRLLENASRSKEPRRSFESVAVQTSVAPRGSCVSVQTTPRAISQKLYNEFSKPPELEERNIENQDISPEGVVTRYTSAIATVALPDESDEVQRHNLLQQSLSRRLQQQQQPPPPPQPAPRLHQPRQVAPLGKAQDKIQLFEERRLFRPLQTTQQRSSSPPVDSSDEYLVSCASEPSRNLVLSKSESWHQLALARGAPTANHQLKPPVAAPCKSPSSLRMSKQYEASSASDNVRKMEEKIQRYFRPGGGGGGGEKSCCGRSRRDLRARSMHSLARSHTMPHLTDDGIFDDGVDVDQAFDSIFKEATRSDDRH